MKYQSFMRKLVLYICAVLAMAFIVAPSISAQIVEPGGLGPSPSPVAPGTPPASTDESSRCTTPNCDKITGAFVKFVNLLSALVGIAVIGSIIWGGLEYITAADNAAKISSAKNRMRNALLALFMYFILYGFLQWLVPGGIF